MIARILSSKNLEISFSRRPGLLLSSTAWLRTPTPDAMYMT
jgi:hypothetical protein